ncbi:hypothetical protein [Halobacterium zhouii]|uniref:hypothetical protein n=1 Tax=Halobacterium zhouii TaxID=2902624 RepID=UPI001E449127|nr:hypothetical protein [Halobacterium zhouii]
MQAGVLGVVDGDFDVVDSFSDSVTDGDRELARRLEIRGVFSLPSGEMAFAGRAAEEYLRERETHAIEDGEIEVREDPRVGTRYTEFVGVPGEFVVVGSGDGEFAFDLVSADTNTDVERATLDLDGFFTAHGSARPWQAGFYGAGDDPVTGVVHGSDLRNEYDLDGMLADSNLNQVGLTYEYDGEDVKMTASRSGYVELYRPQTFGREDYLEYLREEVLSHVE